MTDKVMSYSESASLRPVSREDYKKLLSFTDEELDRLGFGKFDPKDDTLPSSGPMLETRSDGTH